jgi:hypothetical protein
MTRRRRGPLALGALAVAVLTVAGSGAADAQGVTDRDPWSGTVIWGGTEGRAVHGSIAWSHERAFEPTPSSFTVDLIVDAEAGQPDGCEPPRFGSSGDAQNPHTSTVSAAQTGEQTWEGSFEVPVAATCNGTYTVGAVIRHDRSPSFTQATTTIRVARPAGKPAQVSASRSERGTVALTWHAPEDGLPPDFTGYRVRRTVGDVSERIADGTDDTHLVDDPGLQPGQAVTYEVMTLRDGPDGTTIASEPATAGVGLPDPNRPGGDDAGDGGPGGAAAGSGPGTGGAPRVARPATGSRGPSVPALPRPATPTTLDTGFGETLPFDLDRVEGPEDPVLPDNGFASLLYDEEAGAGLLVPGATAAVLAVWAMHLRYLNRLAKRP